MVDIGVRSEKQVRTGPEPEMTVDEAAPQEPPQEIAPPEKPLQFEEPPFSFLIEVDDFLWVSRAREAFRVDGEGFTAAVLDTGLNVDHVDFEGKVPVQVNFTNDNGGRRDDADDGNGHGTNVAGIIAANGDHTGIAPGAQIIPIKVLPNEGGGSFDWIARALQWVLDHRDEHNISVVCMSLGNGGNFVHDNFGNDRIRNLIRALRREKVAVVIAAGNHYFSHNSEQGMSYPAIIRECVSVGAVYDAPEGGFTYGDGAKAFSSQPGAITPFSQRLHPRVNLHTYTDIFAPGAPVTSSGIQGRHGASTQHGTSQATPVIAGLILLMQELYHRVTGELPQVDDLVKWLRRGGVAIYDGDDEDDNVKHTNLKFVRADAVSALDAIRRSLHKRLLRESMRGGDDDE